MGNIASLLTAGVDTSPFEGLNPRCSKPIGAPSLFYSPSAPQYVISMLLLNLMATIKVSDMVRLINKAFQCLSVFNLDLRTTYDQVFSLLCIWRRYLALEGTLEKFPPSGSASLELEGVDDELDLQGISRQIVNHFSNVSESINYLTGHSHFRGAKKRLANRELSLSSSEMHMWILSRRLSASRLEGRVSPDGTSG